jgi:lipopolysaccharide heptosyltransferase II
MINNTEDGKLMHKPDKARRYVCDRAIRAAVMWIMNRITVRSRPAQVDFRGEDIERILLVRGLFRMGNAMLATPAISLLRYNFPTATIDFVGPRVTKKLFQNLPINRYFEIHRRWPMVCWSYLVLLYRLHRGNYDLALDASGSSAALGAFIVGFSGARFRIGIRGKWDRWFNIRVERPASVNKYTNLRDIMGSLRLQIPKLFPALMLSPADTAEAKKQIAGLISGGETPIVGIFIGGRQARGKRWPIANFVELATRLRVDGSRPIVFVGPEEKEFLVYLQSVLPDRIPVIFEPDIKRFASLVTNCHLFVACDSGPVHLACALRVRTVAIFLKRNFDRWGPPAELGRIVFRQHGVTMTNVLEACRLELSAFSDDRPVANIVNG